jgi:hypothetical protein
VVLAVLGVALLWNIVYIAKLASHRQYTLARASTDIRGIIDQHPESPRLMIGHGAIEVTFFNHVPAINEFGSEPLSEKLDTYRPGWILVWEDAVDFPSSPEVRSRYAVVPRGVFPALDQVGRRRLLLYQLQPLTRR